nr:PREDICTED: uncharacterized protein LOC109033046 [Bemisia tabaci]
MYSFRENQNSSDESSVNSTCSETPSELEARLYSILHYNDLNEPLPPEITSNYSITVSGTDVCIAVNKNQLRSVGSDMPESLCQERSSCKQNTGRNSLKQSPLEFNHVEQIDVSKSIALKNNKEFEIICDTEIETNRKEHTVADFDQKLSAYVSYVSWMKTESDNFRQTVRNIVRNLPYPHSDPTSYAKCKELVLKYARPIDSLKKKLKEKDLFPNELKQIFSQFITEACTPRSTLVHKAVSEFLDYLNPTNVDTFESFNLNEIRKLYSNILQKNSSRKESVREIVLKKFKNFVAEKSHASKNECVKRFCSEMLNLPGESVLVIDADFKEQMFATYDIYQACTKEKMVTETEKYPDLNDNEDSSSESSDGLPLKKRKLDNGEESIVCEKDSENDLRNLLLKHNPYISENESLRRVFKQFHEFSMKEKRCNPKHKFVKVLAKYKRTSDCFNTLYCGLIKESLLRELFIFGNQLKDHTTAEGVKATEVMIESLVKKALVAKSLKKCRVQEKVSRSEPGGLNEATQSEINLNENVITISSDESDIEVISSPNANPSSTVTQDKEMILNIETCSAKNQAISKITRPASNSTSKSNGYASNCPPSWSDEMISYYCKSWGGKTFDHVDILKELKATTKPSDWKVSSYQDLLPSRKRKRGKQCNRCLQWGHLQYQCKEPNKPVVCSICGGYNHSQNACTDTKCLRCGSRTKSFQDGCQNCRAPKKCTLCDSTTHDRTYCPDTWRSYHLTVEGSIKIPPELPMNQRQFCCNCTKSGHLDYFCPLLRGSKTFNIINSPYVLNYNVDNVNTNQCSYSSIVTNSVSVPNARKNNPVTKRTKSWKES